MGQALLVQGQGRDLSGGTGNMSLHKHLPDVSNILLVVRLLEGPSHTFLSREQQQEHPESVRITRHQPINYIRSSEIYEPDSLGG